MTDVSVHNNRSVAEYVQRWGNHASIALLDPACKIFSVPTIDGIIGYRLESTCVVVFGDPVCAPEDIPRLTQAFHDFCQQQCKSIVYVIASEQFMNWALQHNICRSALGIGDEIIIDPMRDPRAGSGANARLLRKKYNHSTRAGVIVKEYCGNNPSLEQEMERVKNEWLKGRSGPQIYLSNVHVFADRAHKRWFYAELNGRVIGVLLLNRIDAHKGWILNVLMLEPEVPNGTSELVVLTAMDALRNEGCRFLSIGTAPTQELTKTEGLGTFSTWLVHTCFNVTKKIFGLGGRQKYWEKFQPRTVTSFLLFTKGHLGYCEVLGIIRAFNVNI